MTYNLLVVRRDFLSKCTENIAALRKKTKYLKYQSLREMVI